MKFERVYSLLPVLEWKTVDCLVRGNGDSIIFEQRGVEVPAHWSQNAADILASKYFRKAGVPLGSLDGIETPGMPSWLWPRRHDSDIQMGGERSAYQVFTRLAGAWTYHGWRMGLFGQDDPEEQARIFFDEIWQMLSRQVAAPNSPQWFNTGLWWAYGIEGPKAGQWYVDYEYPIADGGQTAPVVVESYNSYEYPQPHACFIQPVADDLVNAGGIMDLWTREVRLFKLGSGTGSNFSDVRGKGELLSGGGKSSGLLSFLRIGDVVAGSIKSGGTTRRAAKMVIVDADHPDIEEFINWKVSEEYKAAALHLGSRVMLREQDGAPPIPGLELPQAMTDRIENGFRPHEIELDFEGEAYSTVSGQNSNNTVRVTDEFMRKSASAAHDWELRARTTGEVVKTLPAATIWAEICRAAWACADPGLQFHDTINEWHTCPVDGDIRASNPCSEYLFLDKTACNLASLNLVAFLDEEGNFGIESFRHAVRLWTVVLDISVQMASFPSREIALGTYNYRTLGLGYMNLGGLLMRSALPYDSDEGRNLAAAITALMTGQAYLTSAEMACELGAFPRWEQNESSFRDVMNKHRYALFHGVHFIGRTGRIVSAACAVWDSVCGNSEAGFRNAQTTVLAPTGTIHLVTDCDTSGIEPDFALIKHKKLAGGGSMEIVNQSVEPALKRIGLTPVEIEKSLATIHMIGTLERISVTGVSDYRDIFACANEISPEGHVRMVAVVQPFLSGAVSKTINMPNSATVEDVSRIYWMAWELGLKAVALYRDGCKMSQPLQAAAPSSKPTGMSTHGEIASAIRQDMLAKGARLEDHVYAATGDRMYTTGLATGTAEAMAAAIATASARAKSTVDPGFGKDLAAALATITNRGQHEYLPWRRTRGYVQKAKIAEHTLFWRVSEYDDGRPGEIFIELSREGSTLRAMANCLAIAFSVALQHGTPLAGLVDKFLDTKFEPSGYVEGHDRIRFASSIADLIARDLAIHYLGRMDLANDKSEIPGATAPAVPAQKSRTTGETCPGCGGLLRITGTCKECENCTYSTGGCG